MIQQAKPFNHYQQLLGLPSPWQVDYVDLSIPDKQITVKILYTGKSVQCQECGASCVIYDHAPEQKWRHLDTMQFETVLIARIPITFFKHRVSNAVSEGLNSKIPVIKASARGFHSFESYRISILFFCAKHNMAIS